MVKSVDTTKREPRYRITNEIVLPLKEATRQPASITRKSIVSRIKQQIIFEIINKVVHGGAE